MDALPELIETIEDGVATLTFNRPERMNAQLWRDAQRLCWEWLPVATICLNMAIDKAIRAGER
jgi:hypothetical protein